MAVKSYALTTRQRLLDFMGLSSSSLSSTQLSVLDRIIDVATEQIERYTGRRFQRGTYTSEVYNTEGGFIFLKNTPIVSVSSVQYRATTQNVDSWDDVDSESYRLDGDIIVGMGGYRFPIGRGMVRVTYIGGYDYDNSATFLSDTLAGDIEYAMWKLCTHMYNNRKASLNVESESIGDYSVTFRQAISLDSEIADILDHYVGLSVGGTLTPEHY